MKKLNGYETAQAYFEQERLPVGGYVLKILDVKYQENSWGDVILLILRKANIKDFLPTITGRRHRRIKNGRVHTDSVFQRTMVRNKITGQCAGLRR